MRACFLRWEFAAFEDKLLRNAVWQGGRGRDSKLCLCVRPRAGKQICILGKKNLDVLLKHTGNLICKQGRMQA